MLSDSRLTTDNLCQGPTAGCQLHSSPRGLHQTGNLATHCLVSVAVALSLDIVKIKSADRCCSGSFGLSSKYVSLVMQMNRINTKLSAIFPLCSGTAVSVWTSSAEAGSGSDLIVLSAVTGARHWALHQPNQAGAGQRILNTAMNIANL